MKGKNSFYRCLRYVRSEEMKARRRLVGDNGGIKHKGKITALREDGCSNALTSVLKDNPIIEFRTKENKMATEYSEFELRADSNVTPLGDCRYDIDGKTIEFAIRKLTVRECYRLMDVPDDVIDKLLQCDETGKQVISNTQHYKCAGNSICVNVLTHIFEQIWYPKEQQSIMPKQLTLF